ncbi:DUF317 domain-containing protein [Streptomyces sp. NPDC001455]|uniref:DUF317 domain-containing protein n=1 Tax=Streptomyces sp. NPDC001455 TaxID=3154518 RepID=UPI00332406D4
MNAPQTVEVNFVSPRHLAGGGDPAWVTVPLHRACGWSHGNDPLQPRVLLSSPDQTILLRLEPHPDGQWWALNHVREPGRPDWSAAFGARTPVELIAAFTDTLTAPSPQASKPTDPYEPLEKAGWSPTGANGLVAPDGTAYVRRIGSAQNPGTWFVTARINPHRRVWQAHFSGHTPPHLISAFTAALADPRPVLRTDSRHSLPTRGPDIVTRQPTPVRPDLIAAALEERIRSLAARRTSPVADTGPPQPPQANHGRSR